MPGRAGSGQRIDGERIALELDRALRPQRRLQQIVGHDLFGANRPDGHRDDNGAERQSLACDHDCTPFNNLRFGRLVGERHLDGRTRDAPKLALPQARLIVLRAERGVEERRIVGTERDPHAGGNQAVQGMGRPVGIETERQVAAGTDLQGNAAADQLLDQRRILRRAHAVADPRHRQVADGGPHAFGTAHLAGMNGAAESVVMGQAIGWCESRPA